MPYDGDNNRTVFEPKADLSYQTYLRAKQKKLRPNFTKTFLMAYIALSL